MESNGDKRTKSNIQPTKSADKEFIPPERHEDSYSILGRPNKITTEVIQSIYDSIRKGMPKDKAAPLAGISEATYYNWMISARKVKEAIEKAKGREDAINIELSEDDSLYLELLEAVALGESEFIREGLEVILAEGPPGYRWAMSRLFRKIFGDKIDVDVQTEPMQLTLELPNMITADAKQEPLQIDTPNNDDN